MNLSKVSDKMFDSRRLLQFSLEAGKRFSAASNSNVTLSLSLAEKLDLANAGLENAQLQLSEARAWPCSAVAHSSVAKALHRV